MKIEVLISAMHLVDLSILERCNINSSCLIINQCDREDYIEEDREYGKVRMISTTDRGLSKSRNLAIDNSLADVCVICDDDIQYREGYERIVEKAFDEIPDADVIVFNINSLNPEIRPQEELFKQVSRVPKLKTYSSVHISFKRERVIAKGIRFDEKFGSGSGMYSMGEDSLFFTLIHKYGLRAYVYPYVFADLSSESSTWFKGYNEKYFYDVGAFLAAGHPLGKNLLKYYYPLRFRNLTELPAKDIVRRINQGIRGYKNGLPFNENHLKME